MVVRTNLDYLAHVLESYNFAFSSMVFYEGRIPTPLEVEKFIKEPSLLHWSGVRQVLPAEFNQNRDFLPEDLFKRYCKGVLAVIGVVRDTLNPFSQRFEEAVYAGGASLFYINELISSINSYLWAVDDLEDRVRYYFPDIITEGGFNEFIKEFLGRVLANENDIVSQKPDIFNKIAEQRDKFARADFDSEREEVREFAKKGAEHFKGRLSRWYSKHGGRALATSEGRDAVFKNGFQPVEVLAYHRYKQLFEEVDGRGKDGRPVKCIGDFLPPGTPDAVLQTVKRYLTDHKKIGKKTVYLLAALNENGHRVQIDNQTKFTSVLLDMGCDGTRQSLSNALKNFDIYNVPTFYRQEVDNVIDRYFT